MKQYLLPVGLALVVILGMNFLLNNKPPKQSAFDERREKLIDSLQYPNAKDLERMEADMEKASGATKTALLRQLSDSWMQLNQPSIATDYLRQVADNEPGYENYMRAGSAMRSLIDFEPDDNLRVNLVYGARYCFETAEKLKPGDLDARIGLAAVLVSGTNQPMEGIMMLRELDAENPENTAINLELGKFSVMSGQFDKAIERFSSVLQKDSLNLQARYMIAQAYLGQQDTSQAIGQLERIKSLTTDPTLVEQVNAEIKNLEH